MSNDSFFREMEELAREIAQVCVGKESRVAVGALCSTLDAILKFAGGSGEAYLRARIASQLTGGEWPADDVEAMRSPAGGKSG